jgi:tetratricopeptide (TPR) repeat protein
MAVSQPNSAAGLLQEAIGHHMAGRAAEAEVIYRRILSREPRHADALHLMGVLAGQNGRPEEAIQWIERAIAVAPRVPLYYDSLAESYRRMGKLQDAARFLAKAVELAPNSAEAANKLGNIQKNLGNTDEAIASFRRAIQFNPEWAEPHTHLGEIFRMRGQVDEATAMFSQVVKLQPNSAEAHNNLGVCLAETGKRNDGIAAYEQAIRLKPDYVDAWENLGRALGAAGRVDESIKALERASGLDPQNPDIHHLLGSAYFEKRRFKDALSVLEKVARARPDYAAVYNEIGSALSELGRLDEAADNFQKALSLDANLPQSRCNMGLVQLRRGRLDEAEASLRAMIELRPDDAEAHYALSAALLLNGKLSEGWREYEWRWHCRGHASGNHKYSFTQWNGEDLRGRSILLHCEQGFGDVIQFVRYVPMVAARGGRVILAVPPEIFPLVKDYPGAERVIAADELVPLDVQCPLLSLPLVFDTRLESIPAKVPYLWPEATRAEQWKQNVGSLSGLKIGLVWGGRPTHANDHNRSIKLLDFAPLADVPGAIFYSLQKGGPAAQAANPPANMRLINPADSLHDFADTAALIANLDLVISIDSAVAHLAGAMGKPVWVLVPVSPDWRWMLHREDSPWYPTMRLFRQTRHGDWQSPIAQMVDALRSFEPAKIGF